MTADTANKVGLPTWYALSAAVLDGQVAALCGTYPSSQWLEQLDADLTQLHGECTSIPLIRFNPPDSFILAV